jgi:hypothetical protein
MIAGGFVRSCIARDRIRDVDYFVANEPKAQKMREQYVRWTKTPDSMIYRTETALTIGNPKEVPIQLIYRFQFDTPADILSWFDFTISQGAIWFGHDQKWRGMCSEALLCRSGSPPADLHPTGTRRPGYPALPADHETCATGLLHL